MAEVHLNRQLGVEQAVVLLIDSWLAADREAPSKQRHTATRVYQRLVSEHGYTSAAVTVVAVT